MSLGLGRDQPTFLGGEYRRMLRNVDIMNSFHERIARVQRAERDGAGGRPRHDHGKQQGRGATLPEAGGLRIISALTHRQIVDLLERTHHGPQVFDSRAIVEITDPKTPQHRYCLSRNPVTAATALDGCHVINTTVGGAEMDKEHVVSR